MTSIAIRDIVRITRGRLVSGDLMTKIEPREISTDSRNIRRGQFFIALKGQNFDGNRFVQDAFKKGAVGAIATDFSHAAGYRGRHMVIVRDALKALQDIAAYHRKGFNIPVIAITGSNGKTTAKEMLSAILSARYNVLKNEGTKNNHIGVPQTLLKLDEGHNICVLEMGANHTGEIRRLCAIANPTDAVITNVGPSHLEFFGDLKGVFKAKYEILESLERTNGGMAILNGDDKFLSKINRLKSTTIRFGLKASNDFRAKIIRMKKRGVEFILNEDMGFGIKLLGTHNVYNALSAIAAASRFNIDYETMRTALSNFEPSSMRLETTRVNDIEIINDSYNSNPLSMECALEVMKHYPAKSRWVVSGDMLELGSKSVWFHKKIGEAIAKCNVKGLVTFGRLSRHTLSQAMKNGMDRQNLWHCSTHDEIAGILAKFAVKGDVVLLKGSRGMKIGEVIDKLRAQGSKNMTTE